MRTLLFGIVAVVSVSCGAPGDPDLTCDSNAASKTLAADVQPILDAKCKSCHGANYTYGDYSDATKSAAATVGKKSLFAGMNATLMVVDSSKKLENSSLWLKLLGGTPKGRSGPKGENVQGEMPSGMDPLPAAELKIFKDWICTGAK
ncbi:MAG: hypothetical protein ACOZQL_08535 [Myxococcota bacterium]